MQEGGAGLVREHIGMNGMKRSHSPQVQRDCSQLFSRGQSLLEVISATLILFVGVTGVSQGFLGFTLLNRKAELSTSTVSGARTVLDRLRLSDISTMPSGGTQEICNPSSNYACVAFDASLREAGSVVVTYCPDFTDNSLEYCDPTVPSRRHLLVEVWENDGQGGEVVTFTTETVFSDLNEL